ncbi:hypothetical protein Tco_1018545 [Tanacetum coccineum]|uniref:Uncharacterized protein n=1 Tax=Tanacetum coccineum TaxID=301880 RepID=A0ABQ5FW66_9ASTR
MVFNSPCLTDKKELIHHEVEMVINSPWIMPLLGTKGLASPEQTATVGLVTNSPRLIKSTHAAAVVPKFVDGSRFLEGSSMLRRHFDVQFNKYSSQELKKIAMLLATSISILKIQDEDLSGNWKINIGKFQFRSKKGTDNQEKDEKQSQNDKTGLGMEKTVKDKAKSKPESQSSQKVNRKVNWSKSKSTPRPKSKKYKFRD